MLTHLLFDLDGTLTDPREGIVACHRHAFTQLGLPMPSEAELVSLIGPPLHEIYAQHLGPARAAQLPAAIAFYRERFARLGQYENRVYDDIPPALEALTRAGFTLLVCTSKAQVFAQNIVRHFGIARYFRGVYGPELTGERSDKAELIAYLLQREGIAPDAAWMIGDRKHDVVGAHANGVRCAGVLWGYGTREELTDAGADTLHQDVSSLLTQFSSPRESR